MTNLERSRQISFSQSEVFQNRIPELRPGLSVVILTKDKPEFILPLLEQLKNAAEYFSERRTLLNVLVGDTGSSDPKILSSYSDLPDAIKVERGLTYNFSKNNNLLSSFTQTEHLLFLNNDIIFSDAGAALWALYTQLLAVGRYDVLGAQMRFESGECQHSGVYFSRHLANWALPYHLGSGDELVRVKSPLEVPALTGAFLAVRSASFFELGGFEEFYLAECQDIDLCLKARRLGGKCFLLDVGDIIHFENGTRDVAEANVADRSHFLRRWQLLVEESFLLPESF